MLQDFAQIDCLPDEILMKIFRHLDVKVFLILRSLSKRFHQIIHCDEFIEKITFHVNCSSEEKITDNGEYFDIIHRSKFRNVRFTSAHITLASFKSTRGNYPMSLSRARRHDEDNREESWNRTVRYRKESWKIIGGNINELQFSYCTLDVIGLIKILQFCPRLKILRINDTDCQSTVKVRTDKDFNLNLEDVHVFDTSGTRSVFKQRAERDCRRSFCFSNYLLMSLFER